MILTSKNQIKNIFMPWRMYLLHEVCVWHQIWPKRHGILWQLHGSPWAGGLNGYKNLKCIFTETPHKSIIIILKQGIFEPSNFFLNFVILTFFSRMSSPLSVSFTDILKHCWTKCYAKMPWTFWFNNLVICTFKSTRGKTTICPTNCWGTKVKKENVKIFLCHRPKQLHLISFCSTLLTIYISSLFEIL